MAASNPNRDEGGRPRVVVRRTQRLQRVLLILASVVALLAVVGYLGYRASRQGVWRPGEDLSDIVEYWDEDRFNTNATILENVLYSRPVEVRDDIADYIHDPGVDEVFKKVGAKPILVEIGREIAKEFAELGDAVEVAFRNPIIHCPHWAGVDLTVTGRLDAGQPQV